MPNNSKAKHEQGLLNKLLSVSVDLCYVVEEERVGLETFKTFKIRRLWKL